MTRCFLRKQTVRNCDLICLFSLHDCVCFSAINDRSFYLSFLSYDIIDTQNPHAKTSQLHSTPNTYSVFPSFTKPPTNISSPL
jgi:hypothetical protein